MEENIGLSIHLIRDMLNCFLDKILERQEKIELMVDNSETLANSATQFRKRSTDLKRTMWWKNCKLWIVVGVAIAV